MFLTNKQLQQELAKFPDELEVVLVSFAGDKEDYQAHNIDHIHDKWEGIGLEDDEGPVLAIEFRRDQYRNRR